MKWSQLVPGSRLEWRGAGRSLPQALSGNMAAHTHIIVLGMLAMLGVLHRSEQETQITAGGVGEGMWGRERKENREEKREWFIRLLCAE